MRPRVRKICGMPSISSAGRIFAPVKDQAKSNSETTIRSHDRALRFGGGAALKISCSPSLTVKFISSLQLAFDHGSPAILLAGIFTSLTHARVRRQVGQLTPECGFGLFCESRMRPSAHSSFLVGADAGS